MTGKLVKNAADLTGKQLNKEKDNTIKLQKIIRERYGDRIDEATKRLCHNCDEIKCDFLPICSDGSDCPYFKNWHESTD